MKYIKSEKISPRKYLLTLEVSDYDLKMLQDMATSYRPFQLYDDHKEDFNFDLSPCEFNNKYGKWALKMWREFWMLWGEHGH